MSNKTRLSSLYIKTLPPDAPSYQIDQTYQRFDQRNNLTVGRPSWDDEIKPYLKKSVETRVKKINTGQPSYGVEDYSLFLAGGVSTFRMGNSINHANRGVTSWESLGNRLPPSADIWEGSPEEASMMVKKAARFFGADIVGIAPLNKKWIFSHAYRADGSHKEIVFEDVDRPQERDDRMVIPEKMKSVIVIGARRARR